jgi:hypothetical protein
MGMEHRVSGQHLNGRRVQPSICGTTTPLRRCEEPVVSEVTSRGHLISFGPTQHAHFGYSSVRSLVLLEPFEERVYQPVGMGLLDVMSRAV